MPRIHALTVACVCAAALASSARADSLRFTPDVDANVSPCVDFYQYACGPWLSSHSIPPDRSAWDPYYELADQNTAAVRAILEGREPGKGSGYQKVTQYYAACMDEAAIEKQGLAPLQPELERIERTRTTAASIDTLAAVHSLDADGLFSLYSAPDFTDPQREIATLDLGWLGLRERDAYLRDDPMAQTQRDSYRAHLTKMLVLSGVAQPAALAGAQAILALETALARARPTPEQRRDPASRYHPMTRAQLEALTPGFSWARYFEGRGVKVPERLNVAAPDYLKAAAREWLSLRPEAQQLYLRWLLLHAYADVLPHAFGEATFEFFSRTLYGKKAPEPRWKVCSRLTKNALGEAIGEEFVERHFSKEQKARAAAQVRAIQAAMREEVQSLAWMSDATRKAALKKLGGYRIKVGYPDRWRDYGALVVKPGEAAGNAMRANRFELARELSKMGKPVDPVEWFSLPHAVDGYESSNRLEVVFTAGFLQPPFFDLAMDDAVNFGAVGRAMGHEFTHGFDDEGRRFDERGAFRDWWTAEDAKRFQERAACLVDEYGAFEVIDGKKLNGKLTLGENIADNGGIRLAFAAMEKALEGKPRAKVEGLTPEQRFFLAFAKTQCVQVTDETLRQRLASDPHSPGKFRVNGTLRNFEEFAKAFACKAGDAMVSEKPCRVW